MSLIKRPKVFLGFTTEAKPDLNFMLTIQTKIRSRQSQLQCPWVVPSTDTWTTLDSRAQDASLPRHVLK